jgi:dihydroorotase
MLAVGMPVEDVIAATTKTAAHAIGRDGRIGSLAVGGVADIAVLDVSSGDFLLSDTFGHTRNADRQISARATIRAGVVWGAPAHPGIGTAVLDR